MEISQLGGRNASKPPRAVCNNTTAGDILSKWWGNQLNIFGWLNEKKELFMDTIKGVIGGAHKQNSHKLINCVVTQILLRDRWVELVYQNFTGSWPHCWRVTCNINIREIIYLQFLFLCSSFATHWFSSGILHWGLLVV